MKCTQNTMTENLLLLKDLLEGWKTRFSGPWQLFQKKFILIWRIDVTSDFYADYNEDSNETEPKSKAGDRVRISKYKNIFAKGYTQSWSEEVFVVSKIKNMDLCY